MIPIHLRDKGRWRHVDGGLDLTKKRLGEFVFSMLKHGGHIGSWWAFNPSYHRSAVYVTIYVTEDIEDALMKDCPWLVLIDPPKVTLC